MATNYITIDGPNRNAYSIPNNTSTVEFGINLYIGDSSSWGTATLHIYCEALNAQGNYYLVGEWIPQITFHGSDHNGRIYTIDNMVVPHLANGTQTVRIRATFNWGSSYYGTLSASSTKAMGTIPRASTMSFSGAFTIGTAKTMTITRASSGFTHKISYSVGSKSGYALGSSSTASSSTTVSWTPPTSLNTEIKSGHSTSGTLTLGTYNGSTKIGTKSYNFTLNLENGYLPVISNVVSAIVNTGTSSQKAALDSWGVAVAGFSKLTITANAEAKMSATVAEFSISGDYAKSVTASGTATDSLSYTGSVIKSSGTKTITVSTTDSRGNKSNSLSTSKTFYSYTAPVVTSLSVGRKNSNNKRVEVLASWNIASVNGNNETVSAIMRYKQKSASSWSEYELDPSINGASTPTELVDVEFDQYHSYDFMLVVADSLSGEANAISFAPALSVTLDLKAGGDGVGIGKVCEYTGLEIGFDTLFNCSKVLIDNGVIGGDSSDVLKFKINNAEMSIRDYCYPVESIYISSSATSPALLFGGTWSQVKGKTIVAVDPDDSDFSASRKSGGSKTVTLTVDQMPSHNHSYTRPSSTTYMVPQGSYYALRSQDTGQSTGSKGGGQAHQNMPPYITYYVWRRTA